MQPPGTARLRATRVGPLAPTPLRMLVRCTQWVRGVQVEASSSCWGAVLHKLNLELLKTKTDGQLASRVKLLAATGMLISGLGSGVVCNT